MAVTPTEIILQPNSPETLMVGSSINAFVQHRVMGRKTAVTGADNTSAPIERVGAEVVTIYVAGTSGDAYEIQAAYRPVYLANGTLDVASTGWVALASGSIPATGVASQSFQDVMPAFRVKRTVGVGAFTVYAWFIS